MDKKETMPLGVVIERRRINHPWKDHSWRAVAVIPGAPLLDPRGPWTLLREDEGWAQYHCGTLELELFRSDTEDYKIGLAQNPPRLFIVLRSNHDPDVAHELLPFLVTAGPYEAQHYMESGEDTVEAVAMPEEVVAFVQAFVDTHHVETVFTKRRREKAPEPGESFSRRPPVDRPRGKGRSGSRIGGSGGSG